MGFRDYVTSNIPKVDLQSYNILLCGNYKVGKTRAWKEIIELHYPNNPEAGLLLAFEPGYSSWELDSVIPMHDYNWEFFREEVVPGLVEEAKNNSVTKVIGVDTADRLLDKATDYILEKVNKKYAKKFTTLQEITKNTDENGYILLADEIKKQFDALKTAGYGFMWLAWTKEKETELIDGVKYNSLELLMPATGKKIFESQADLICCLFPETKALDKEGNVLEKNKKNKKGKDVATNFHTTEVMMYFRPSNYISISGGRFLNLPEKVPYSAENFLKVFEEAVKGQLKKTDKSVEELKVAEQKNREDKIKEVDKKSVEKLTVEEQIKEIAKKIKSTAKQKAKDGVSVDEINKIVGKTLKFDTVEQAQAVLDKLNALSK